MLLEGTSSCSGLPECARPSLARVSVPGWTLWGSHRCGGERCFSDQQDALLGPGQLTTEDQKNEHTSVCGVNGTGSKPCDDHGVDDDAVGDGDGELMMIAFCSRTRKLFHISKSQSSQLTNRHVEEFQDALSARSVCKVLHLRSTRHPHHALENRKKIMLSKSATRKTCARNARRGSCISLSPSSGDCTRTSSLTSPSPSLYRWTARSFSSSCSRILGQNWATRLALP